MTTMLRRDASTLLLAGCGGLLARRAELRGVHWIDSVVRGVQIGAQSYSFRDRSLGEAVQGYQAVGLGECELWQGHVEPDTRKASRDELREWRLTVPLSHFRDIRREFDDAGVELYAYNYSFRKDFTDPEIERGFEMAEALGVRCITASSNVSIAGKIDTYAQKHRITVGFHNHDNTADPDEFSTSETFERALRGASGYLAINLDIGHLVAANGDPVAFLRERHARIVTLHIKDHKKNHGPNVPFGEGDVPIKQVLRLLRDNHWRIPANIEYEYGKIGIEDTVTEMKKCYTYCLNALETG